MSRSSTGIRIYISLALLSAAIIAFQLALMQILSIVQWHHFAYMVISVALLGFGAAGTFLAIFRKWLVNSTDWLLPMLMMSSGITMAVVTGISQQPGIRFDSYLLFTEYEQTSRLLLTYLLFFVPFFLGALAIGLIFVKYVGQIGTIYFANLFGSGAGGILAIGLMSHFFPKELPAIISILPLISGSIVIRKQKRVLTIAFAAFSFLLVVWVAQQPSQLFLSQFKSLSKTLLLPDAKITGEKPSQYGLIQTVSSPALRYAPGLSLTAKKAGKIKQVVFENGNWFGPITDWQSSDSAHVLDYTTLDLAFRMAARNRVLVLHAGTGMEVAHALTKTTEQVDAIEPNKVILTMLKNELATETDSLWHHEKLSVHAMEPRTFLLSDTAKYDLILLPVIETFGGSAGIYALKEQFTFTKEAFREMFRKLTPTGVICITSWMDYPVRNPLKVLATMTEVLEEAGIHDVNQHIAAVRSWGTITFVMKRLPITGVETKNIRTFCEQMMFDPVILPDLQPGEQTEYNQLQDNRIFEYIEQILSPEREQLYGSYDFNIRPATDSKPYFSQFIRWRSLSHLADFFGSQAIPFFEIGYLIVMLTLFQIAVIAFVLIILPLFKIGWKGGSKSWIILYFSGIGLGFMFVEIVLIQRFILYFGNPIFSASAVITSVLIFSGLGSYASGKLKVNRKYLLTALGLTVFLILIYAVALTRILQLTIAFPLGVKLIVMLLLLAPLSFCMGFPFPFGLTMVSQQNENEVPWAWGINGCVSVISTALATVIAVELGFIWVMIFAALAYCFPVVVSWRKNS